MTTDLTVAPTRGGLESLTPAQRDAAVTAYLVDARDRLALALAATGPEQVKAIKAEASVIAEMSRQVGVSKEIQTDAQEMVRRSEFALGKAIRAGQEAGTVRKNGEHEFAGNQHGAGPVPETNTYSQESPKAFFGTSNEMVDTYAMSDNVTEEEFEAALTEARAEGNVSRANVVRKVKERTYSEAQTEKWERVAEMAESGYTSPQIARAVGMSESGLKSGAGQRGITFPADKHTRNTRRLDSNRIVRESIASLEGIVAGLELINPGDLDVGEAPKWVDSLTEITTALAKAKRTIKESIS